MKIRFRVWDGKKMWYPEDMDRYEGGGFYIDGMGDLFVDTEDNWYPTLRDLETTQSQEPMLSTGCFDKNGKEIWDGDIVLWSNLVFKDLYWLVRWSKGTTNYLNAGWYVTQYRKERLHGEDVVKYNDFVGLSIACYGWPNLDAVKPEVAGNICETMKLLEGE